MRDFLFGYTGVWTWDLWNSSPALYHCPTVTSGFHRWQFQVFNSGAEGLVVVLFWLDLWEIFFLATPGLEPSITGSLVLHSTSVSWWFQVLFLLDLWEIFFLATPGFEPGDSGSLVLHSTTVPQWFLVFTSDNVRYLTLVQRDWWWYCSDWTCERFSLWPHQGLNLRPLDF